jgi:hypothetical protein
MRATPGARIVATLVVLWGGLVFQPSTTVGSRVGSRAIDQVYRSATRPLPAAPAPKVAPAERVWVPDRYVAGSDGLVHMPGHWERRINDQEVHTPPLSACPVTSGPCILVPAGVRPEPEARPGL